MSTRKQVEMQQKQMNILSAAKSLFIKKGYIETSIDEVAYSASISKGSLYTYFSSKQDILAKLVAQAMQKLSIVIREVINDNDFLLPRLWKVIENYTENYNNEVYFLKLYSFLDLSKINSEIAAAIAQQKNDSVALIANLEVAERTVGLFDKKETVVLGSKMAIILWNLLWMDIINQTPVNDELKSRYELVAKI